MHRKDDRSTVAENQIVTVGSLFAAIGGFASHSTEQPFWANEKDKFAAETFRLNFPMCGTLKAGRRPVGVWRPASAGRRSYGGLPMPGVLDCGEKRGFDDPRGLLSCIS